MASRTVSMVRWLLAVVLALSVALLALPVHAAVSVCRGDPVVRLSNGLLLRMSVVVGVGGSQVRDVTYTVHAPPGVTITNIVYTGGELKLKEVVRLVNDTRPGVYRTDTVVRTYLRTAVNVTANFDWRRAGGSSSGLSGQTLSVTLNP